MLLSVLLLSLYTVMNHSYHPECLVYNSGWMNHTENISLAFKGGFGLTLIEFINSSILNILVRLKVERGVTSENCFGSSRR